MANRAQLNGYIKLYRQMLDWEWYDDVNTKAVFLHLLLTASFEEKKWHGETIKRGQLITSVSQLASDLKLTVQNVRTALKHLQLTNEITVRSTPNYSVITILSYGFYQDDNKQANKRLTNDQQTDNKRLTNDQQHLKNDKKEKNDKNDKNSIYTSICIDKNEPKTENSKEYFDFQAIINLFNSVCRSLPKIQKLTESRKRNIMNADKQLNGKFQAFFERVEQSDFLSGRKTEWKAGFDWIIKPQNLIKIIEGNYDNQSKPATGYYAQNDDLPF